MRIIKFAAENIKKLRAVEITPEGNIIEVTGPNGSGKSSVLDAIFYALAGTSEVPAQVVRQGEEKAVIRLDLGELVVTRRFTAAGGTSLVVEAASGARFPSPQRMLDDLIGVLAFDPLAFMRLKPKEQLEALRQVVRLDLSAIDVARQRYFEARTATNRIVWELETRLAAIPRVEPGTPDVEVDVSELGAQLQRAAEHNQLIKQEFNEREQRRLKVENDISAAEQKAGDILGVKAEAQQRINEIIVQRDQMVSQLQEDELKLRQRAKEEKEKLESLPALSWPIDLNGFQEKIKDAAVMNHQVRLKQQRQKLQDDLKLQVEKAAGETAVIEGYDQQRRQAIAAAQMPVEGLSFSELEVLFNGLPLVNASSGEQLRVSVALAMVANPKLRVLRVKDGSLLDEANLKLLGEMAAAGDYQVWVERVEDSHGRPCVVMEDGSAR